LGEDDVGVEDLDSDEAVVLAVERDERVDIGGRLGTVVVWPSERVGSRRWR
jgi:hypothetical protein